MVGGLQPTPLQKAGPMSKLGAQGLFQSRAETLQMISEDLRGCPLSQCGGILVARRSLPPSPR